MSDTLRVIQLMVQKFRDDQLSLVGSLSPLFIRVLKNIPSGLALGFLSEPSTVRDGCFP